MISSFKQLKNILFIVLAIAAATPYVSAPIALFMGLAYALIFGTPFPRFSRVMAKYLLQISVVGLGFGMHLGESLQAGAQGMLFTVVSVVSVLFMGIVIGKFLGVPKTTSYLIASGTAICGGSAIAAVGPISKANDSEMSVSLATIFLLNAVALFVFPAIGHWAALTQEQFGLWAAIAIHDTSSVVGAGAVYGDEALKIATTVKLTRALWIIPLSVFTIFYFKTKGQKIVIPWFILFFVLAMVTNTYFNFSAVLFDGLVSVSRQALVLTLFFIGAGMSRKSIQQLGIKPLILGVLLWVFIAVMSFAVVMFV